MTTLKKILHYTAKVMDFYVDWLVPAFLALFGLYFLILPPPIRMPNFLSSFLVITLGLSVFLTGYWHREALKIRDRLDKAERDRLRDVESFQKMMTEGGAAEITRRTEHFDDHTVEHVVVKAKIGPVQQSEPSALKNSFGA